MRRWYFAACVVAIQAVAAGADQLPAEAGRSAIDAASQALGQHQYAQAAGLAKAFLDDRQLAHSPLVPLAEYYRGYALFQMKEYASAARSLAQLAPFDQEFGPHARYLLGRIHHLAGEFPEAMADYKSVAEGFAAQKRLAGEALKGAGLAQERKHFLEGLASGPAPEYVARASFYYASLLGETGHTAEAIERLRPFADAHAKTPLAQEATVRLGLSLLQMKNFAEAKNVLQPLCDGAVEPHPFLDQALWFSARAQMNLGDAANAQAVKDARQAGLELYRKAAEAAGKAAAAGDGEAAIRRADILLEIADAQLAASQYKDAAGTYGTVVTEFSAYRMPEAGARVEQALERQITALHLAGEFKTAGELAKKFVAGYPKSLLMPSVLLRSAETNSLSAIAASADPLRAKEAKAMFEESVAHYQKLIADYPDSPQINAARQAVGNVYCRLGQYGKAAEAFQSIPDAERSGELSAVSYVQGDCLLRTLPPEGEDALTAGRLLQQAETAAKNFSNFAGQAPANHPLIPEALLKLGFAHQRIAEVLADQNERRRELQMAREAYEKLIALSSALPVETPTSAMAIFERAKVMILLGDFNGGGNELRRFTTDPLQKTAVALPAVTRCAVILRAQYKPLDAVDIVKQFRERNEAALAANPASAAMLPMLMYEQAMAMKETGTPENVAAAREMFEQLAQSPAAAKTAVAGECRWRLGQSKREELARALTGANKAWRAAVRPEAVAATEKNLAAVVKNMEDWITANMTVVEEQRKAVHANAGGADNDAAETALRMAYEIVWARRVLSDVQLDAARSKLPAGSTTTVALQPMEIKTHQEYRELIAAADKVQSPLAIVCRMEWAEMLMERGDVPGASNSDTALELLTDALEQNPVVELADRARIRIAACLLARKQPDIALKQATIVLNSNRWPYQAEARYLCGAACLAQKDMARGIDILTPFRSEARLFNNREVADRALFELATACRDAKRIDDSRTAAGMIIARYPNSPLVEDARKLIADLH